MIYICVAHYCEDVRDVEATGGLTTTICDIDPNERRSVDWCTMAMSDR